MAKNPPTTPFKINSYIPRSEMIELDEEPAMRNTRYSPRFTRNQRVSPTPSYVDNFMTRHHGGSYKPKQRQQKLLLVLSGLFSLVTFTLVLGLVLGFIQPRNLETCKCDSTTTSGGSGALKLDEHEAAENELRNDIANMKKMLDEHKEKIAAYEIDIRNLYSKIDETTTSLANVTTTSYFSEKLNQLAKEVWKNTTEVLNDVKENNLRIDELADKTREEISQSKNISLSQLQELKLFSQSKFTEVFKKTEETDLKLKKFQSFQKDNERNYSLLTQNIDDISTNILKLKNDTNERFQSNLNTMNETNNDIKKQISDNDIRYKLKITQLGQDAWINTTKVSKMVGKNSLEVRKFVNETRDEISHSQNISLSKIHQLKQTVQLNVSDLLKETNDLEDKLNKLSTSTSAALQKASSDNQAMLHQLKTTNERNLTTMTQSIARLSQNIIQLQNDTNNKLKANMNAVNQLLDPTKFRGPRGYNGTTGQPGPQGPAGPPGPPMTIDFTNCQHGTQQKSGTKRSAQIWIAFEDTKTNLVLAVTCESSISRGTISQSQTPSTNGLRHKCTCDNSEGSPKAFTCTIRYLLCPR